MRTIVAIVIILLVCFAFWQSMITVRVIEQHPKIVTTITQRIRLPVWTCVEIMGDGVMIEMCR